MPLELVLPIALIRVLNTLTIGKSYTLKLFAKAAESDWVRVCGCGVPMLVVPWVFAGCRLGCLPWEVPQGVPRRVSLGVPWRPWGYPGGKGGAPPPPGVAQYNQL